MSTLLIPGRRVDAEHAGDGVTSDGTGLQVGDAFRLHGLTRSGGEPQPMDLDAADIVEVAYEDGSVEWMRGDTLLAQIRAGSATRGAADGTLLMPTTLGDSGTTRGGARRVIASLRRFLKPDPKKLLPDHATDIVAEHGARWAIRKLAAKIEAKLYGDASRVFYWPRHGQLTAIAGDDLKRASTDQPFFVFLHGTFSCCYDAFGAFALIHPTDVGKLPRDPENVVPGSEPIPAERFTKAWHQLQDMYPGRVLALEHKTLSESPIDNAQVLVDSLPTGARLHVISHSRGGLVGDLLEIGGLRPEHVAIYDTYSASDYDGDDRQERLAERDRLLHLAESIRQKDITVERFVRAASPARGTILASDRLEKYVSVLLSVLGTPLKSVPVLVPFYDLAKEVLLRIVQFDEQVSALPGLEAMDPAAPVIHVLNESGLTVDADVGVMAGDVATNEATLGERLKILAADLFYREQHDFVVHTRSMTDGLPRTKGVYRQFLRGPDASHSNYFYTHQLRDTVLAWFRRREDEAYPDAFKRYEPEQLNALQRFLRRDAATPQPAVIIVPDRMATLLGHDGRPVWLNPAILRSEGPAVLRLNAPNDLTPLSVPDTLYGTLAATLSAGYDVIVFPYDWRRSHADAAQDLAKLIEKHLDRTEQPIHLLTHGSGALVARTLLADAPATWEQIVARGGRLTMLAPALHGDPGVLGLLLGTTLPSTMLGLLGPRTTAGSAAWAQVLRTFPGLLELLPEPSDAPAWTLDWWNEHAKQPLPENFGDLLGKAHAFRQRLASAAIPSSENLTIICGAAARTPVPAPLRETAGDGILPHPLSRLPGVRTYFAPLAHGDLPGRLGQAELLDVLLDGSTSMLGSSPPETAQASVFTGPVFLPRPADLLRILGGSAWGVAATERVHTLTVQVVHGDLRDADYPVAVGHYYGDVIVGAEAALDQVVDGALRTRNALGRYPGASGSCHVSLTPDNPQRGALVIGLGEIGELSAETVTQGIAQALLELALLRQQDRPDDDTTHGPLALGVSSVLIGTSGAQTLSVEASMAATVKGALLANRSLRDSGLFDRVRIGTVQFIELYEEVAIEAGRAARRLSDLHLMLQPQEALQMLPDIVLSLPSGRVGQPLRVANDAWWQRLIITRYEPELPRENPADLLAQAMHDLPEPIQQALASVHWKHVSAQQAQPLFLKFLVISDRARVEELFQPKQTQLLRTLIADTIRDTGAFQAARTLYQLVMPNAIKALAPDMSNLALIVDSHTASYPWELMTDEGRNPDQATPLAVRTGLIRQFKTRTFREQIQPISGERALVIGDPVLDEAARRLFPPLEAARREAAHVADTLAAYNYTVERCITDGTKDTADGPRFVDVLNALFKAPQQGYRIVHIAAHGIFRADDPMRSGVVLGNNIYLTAAEIQQLPVVPDFVFLNCCHLAQMADDEPARPSPTWNQLAASASRALIDAGVRAVIAAGWAVDDVAAQQFASVFYKEMLLRGAAFGDAVREARRAVYQDHSHTNTWGAYQCYGDPSFRFKTSGRRSGAADRPVAQTELQRLLANEKKRVAWLDRTAYAAKRGEILRKEETCPDAWRSGKLYAAFADLYADLGYPADAVRCYEEALRLSDGTFPMRAYEQRFNQLARHAEALYATDTDEASRRMDQARALAEWLLDIPDRSQFASPEQLALVGAFFKRQSRALSGNERTRAIQQARTAYADAYTRCRTTGRGEPYYYLLNELAMALLDSDANYPDEAERETYKLEMERVYQELQVKPRLSFWEHTFTPDGALMLAFLDGVFGESADPETRSRTLHAITTQYHDVLSRASSPNARDSVTSQIRFLRDMTGWEPRRRRFPHAEEGLGMLLGDLSR